MRSLLIVGADHLGTIPQKLIELGFSEVTHLCGRKVQMVKREIPENVDSILVLTDFINHNLAKALKKKAQDQSVPVYYAKRSWCSIYQALSKCELLCPVHDECKQAIKH
ncbi:DUF2325 domain-containing protein [Anaerobacillus isosaccharinicus]|uniref:DUF2325 domain-containing protein n=1 Tax=Anaerobacillus isosaccharinicus TaxID=1532552 RepID=A0A1S2M2G3_9BACI|nr:DUF2325 domain-containing protein [Anaerobacillus isosaccharinicus]MBA5585581.1 DUF2325 domain-containing protein [Anaerobacillus isosaccharinicus]QOY36106.1 DUF2325 domain-containing protein [Anaerobacillus isosaccharinicus]